MPAILRRTPTEAPRAAGPSVLPSALPALTGLRHAMWAVVDLAVPLTCGGCGARGQRWCPACQAELAGPSRAEPVPPPRECQQRPPTWAVHDYDGGVGAAIVAYKDGERRDLLEGLDVQLARSLRAAVEALDPQLGPALVVPVPASTASIRRRGDAPLDALGRAAVRHVTAELGPGCVIWAPVLRVQRRVGDQAGLSSRQRAANVAGAYTVRGGRGTRSLVGGLEGAPCVVLDDVTTTGASLAEAARALRAEGAVMIHAAVIAATRLRCGSYPAPPPASHPRRLTFIYGSPTPPVGNRRTCRDTGSPLSSAAG